MNIYALFHKKEPAQSGFSMFIWASFYEILSVVKHQEQDLDLI